MSARHIVWIKPADRTVPLHAPNPPTDVKSADELELATDQNGNPSTMLPGDTIASVFADDIAGTSARFSYNRNPPSTNATETVGSTYRITLFGLVDARYDVRYRPGTLTVVAE